MRLKSLLIFFLLGSFVFSMSPIVTGEITNPELSSKVLIPEEETTISSFSSDSYQSYAEKMIAEFMYSQNDLIAFDNITGYDILNETEFTNFATVYKTSGDGTLSNPYIFDKLQITGNMSFSNVESWFVFRNSYFNGGKISFEGANLKEISDSLFVTTEEGAMFFFQNGTQYLRNIFISDGVSSNFQGQTNVVIAENTFISFQQVATSVRIQTYYNGSFFPSNNVSFTDNKVLATGNAFYSYINGFAEFLRNNFTVRSGFTIDLVLNFIVDYEHNISDNIFKYVGEPTTTPKIEIRRTYLIPSAVYVMNNTFLNFNGGLQFTNQRNLHVRSNTFEDCETGIFLKGVSNENDFTGNSFSNCSLGYYFFYSNGNIIDSSSITDTNIGSIFSSSNDNLFNNSKVTRLNWFLYNYGTSSNNTDVGTIAVDLVRNGIVLESDADVLDFVANNTISGSGNKSDPFVFSGMTIDGGIGISIDTNYSIYFKDLSITGISSPLTQALSFKHGNYSIFENVTIVNSFTGIFLSEAYDVVLNDVFVSNISNQGDGVFIDKTQNLTIDNLVIKNVYRTGLKIAGSNRADLFRINIDGTSQNSVLIQGVDSVLLSNSTLQNGRTMLRFSSILDLNVTDSSFRSFEQYFSFILVQNSLFLQNVFDTSTKMSTMSYPTSLNFTNNVMLNNVATILNATSGSVYFKGNYFINNSEPLVGKGGERIFEGNYYSTLGNQETMLVLNGTVDTSPIRPYVTPSNTSYESGTTYLYDFSSQFRISLNYSLMIYNNSVIGKLVWNGGEVSSVEIYTSDLNSPGEYQIILETIDTWGVTGNQSLLIRIVDTLSPVISSPPDVTLEVNSSSYVSWVVSDINLNNYTLFINGTSVESGVVSTDTLTFELNTSYIGTYNYTIQVFDKGGNWVVDSVVVIISPPPVTTTETSADVTSTLEDTTKPSIEQDKPNPSGWVLGFISIGILGGITFYGYQNPDKVKNLIGKIKLRFNKD